MFSLSIYNRRVLITCNMFWCRYLSKHFQKVRFNGYYPNIDLYYTTEGEQLSYGFKIFPGGSPGLIGFTFEGCDEVKLQSSGDLLLTHRFGTISQSRPKAWYFKEGQKKEIAVETPLKISQ